jgi:hypothetical protein
MVGDFDVNMVGRERDFPSPALLNYLDELLGDVDAPTILPPILKPLGQFFGGVVVENIDIQLPLFGETRKSEITRAEKAGDGIVGIGAVAQVELGVERVPEEKFYHHLTAFELVGKAAESDLVGVGRHAQHQLVAKILGEFFLQAKGGLVVQLAAILRNAQGLSKFILRGALHAHEQAALFARLARPAVNKIVDGFPSP